VSDIGTAAGASSLERSETSVNTVELACLSIKRSLLTDDSLELFVLHGAGVSKDIIVVVLIEGLV
jgi:hypothetical protein